VEHFFNGVKGWASFRSFYFDAVKEARQGARFVEIGSWYGKSSALMAVEIINSGKHIWFDCVDPWSDGGPDLKHKQVKGLYEAFLKNMAPVMRVITPVRMLSLEAAPLYPDGSLDLVLIDGSHVYEDVLADIHAWAPKVRPGGVLAGDDYGWPGVKQACDEYFEREVGEGPPGRTVPHACWRVRL
jgi:predicted O-methyltransferase YrrM